MSDEFEVPESLIAKQRGDNFRQDNNPDVKLGRPKGAKSKPRTDTNLTQAHPDRKLMTTGQRNIMLAKVIDLLNAQESNQFIRQEIRQYYKDTVGYEHTNPFMIINEAKALWLQNFSLPQREQYKKDMYIRSEMLEEEIRNKSKKDITVQANELVSIWKYKDNLAGLNNDNGIGFEVKIDIDDNAVTLAMEGTIKEDEE